MVAGWPVQSVNSTWIKMYNARVLWSNTCKATEAIVILVVKTTCRNATSCGQSRLAGFKNKTCIRANFAGFGFLRDICNQGLIFGMSVWKICYTERSNEKPTPRMRILPVITGSTRGKSPVPTNQVDVGFNWNQEKINTLLSMHPDVDVAKQQVQNSKCVSASAHCTRSHIHYHTLSHTRWQATVSKQSME